jgi:hypothetical protein
VLGLMHNASAECTSCIIRQRQDLQTNFITTLDVITLFIGKIQSFLCWLIEANGRIIRHGNGFTQKMI